MLPLLRPLRLLLPLALLLGAALPDGAIAPEPAQRLLTADLPPPADSPEAICDGDAACLDQRWILVDLDQLGVPGLSGQEWMAYDLNEVTRALPYNEFEGETEVSLAVRLILSEVGADRLVDTRSGIWEAFAILFSIDNRLNPVTANPLEIAELRPFPGCGPHGDFASCSNAVEYLGMDTWRAVDPGSRYTSAMLQQAADLSVIAWTLHEQGRIPDFTQGSTSYVHRCGGVAYGFTTWHCDGTMDKGIADVPGAHPHTGPLVMKRPGDFNEQGRYYDMEIVRFVDYEALEPGQMRPVVGAVTPALTPRGMDASAAETASVL